MFKRVLVSVSDKTGLAVFLKPLAENGAEIVSTGGTAKFLISHGIKVTEVSEVTGFPEMMDGRVRTLHPKIHMALLARSFVPDDMKILKDYGVEPFDLVVVNLYPFEEAYKKGLRGKDLIEQIDIGGPSMLRAAAKSFERVTVVCDPDDYKKVLETESTYSLRQELACKVFEHCAFYDSLVADALNEKPWELSKTKTVGLRKKSLLRYGENPHQISAWYETPLKSALSLSDALIIQGKELSFNNLVDLEAALGALNDFSNPTCVIVKHATPCGVAEDSDITAAYTRSFLADPISAFGGIVALNRSITRELASELVKTFLECVVAPSIDEDALEILKAKKNLRVLTLESINVKGLSKRSPRESLGVEFKSLRGGALFQEMDGPIEWKESFKIIPPRNGIAELDANLKENLLFAQRIVRHVKSNAIVVTENLQTLGICGGQTNRVDSVRWALARAKGKGSQWILGSDAFFPFRDSIDLAAEAGVKWIVQPGGSVRDTEVELAAKEHGIGMVITGIRHFKH